MSNIYVGEHRRNADEKGRVLLPSKWRFGSDQNEVYIAIPNPSGCITVYPPKMVEKLREKASNISLGDKKGQKILTKFFSKADQLVCDSQGRISVGQMLESHAALGKEILMVGNFVTFSIWNPLRYGAYMDSDNDDDYEVSKILTQLGL
jgi:MraZ protein